MKYLNFSVFKNVPEKKFSGTTPYPWVNFSESLTPEGFQELLSTLPDVSLFEKSFNLERSYGQKPHDRFELRYSPGLNLSPAWSTFIEELSSSSYRQELERLFGVKNMNLRFQWQYSFTGCSVSPHCDSGSKVGSHIFYFNTPVDWKEEWGGQTLVLDDLGKLSCDSAPDIAAFTKKEAVRSVGNYSLLFARTEHSWHCVETLKSPPGALRKIFTVIIEKKPTLGSKIALKLKGFISSAVR